MFKPKGKAITIYLSENESRILDNNPLMKNSLMQVLVQAKDDFFIVKNHPISEIIFM